MAIHIGLTSALDNKDIRCNTVITNSLMAAKKILVLHIHPHQSTIIPIASKIVSYLNNDLHNSIHIWYCPSKAKWSKHAIVDELVKEDSNIPVLPSKDLYLFSKKKECDNLLKELQTSFQTNKNRGQLFLDFEDDKERVIKPTYTEGGLWLPIIGTTNSICARFTRMTVGHAPISKYRQHFFPNSPINCPCSQAEVQTRKHIVTQCNRGLMTLTSLASWDSSQIIQKPSASTTVDVHKLCSLEGQKCSQRSEEAFFLLIPLPSLFFLLSVLLSLSFPFPSLFLLLLSK